MTLRTILASAAVLALAACSGGDDPIDPTPDSRPPDPPGPTALSRCADVDHPIAMAWEVDNIRAPLIAQAQAGGTIVVASGDGAVKTWVVDGLGTPSDPAYGTPLIDDAAPVTALAAAPAGGTAAIAGLDMYGQTRLWSPAGAELHPSLSLTGGEAGAYVAVDNQQRWIAGGTAAHGGALAVADLATGTVTGPLETPMWNITDAAIGGDGVLVTVGHMYGCPAIEVRDPREPAAVIGYWDGCLNGGMYNGWLRAVALAPDASTAIAVGDGLVMRFDLADVTAGPVDVEETDLLLTDVAWSAADGVAIAIGPHPEVGSNLTVWSTDDLSVARRIDIPEAIGLTVEPSAGLLVTARADGMLRADRCAE